MTKREIGSLMIGLGGGLTLAVVAVVQVLASFQHQMFIVGYRWDKPIAAVPFLLVILGLIHLLKRKEKREPARD
jgi:hypothetical protein